MFYAVYWLVKQINIYLSLFKEKKILTLICLFIVETAYLMHKRCVTLSGTASAYNTRRAIDVTLPLPIPKSALTKHSIIYESRKIYNHLPLSIKSIVSPKYLKKKLKELLVDKAYYTLQEYYDDAL